MRLVPALWAAVAVLVPICEAALSHRNAAGLGRRTVFLRHHKEMPVSDQMDAALRARSEVEKFGPSNCVSTWRNEDGHCEVATKCKDDDIAKYSVKFICIDDGGEKVRHVFAAGSFDSEEQFDTLIECKKCMAEKQETIQVLSDEPSKNNTNETDELGGNPLKELRDEVKQLEGFMMNTSAVLQKLNAKVYAKGYVPPAEKPLNPMPSQKAKPTKDAAAASSLVHHSTSHQEISAEDETPLRVQAQAVRVKMEHRRHLAEDEDEDVIAPRKASKLAARNQESVASMAGAVKTAEERDEEAPGWKPARSHMELSKITVGGTSDAVPHKPKPLVVSLPKATPKEVADAVVDGSGADDVAEGSEGESDREPFAALQQGEDGDDSDIDGASGRQDSSDSDDGSEEANQDDTDDVDDE